MYLRIASYMFYFPVTLFLHEKVQQPISNAFNLRRAVYAQFSSLSRDLEGHLRGGKEGAPLMNDSPRGQGI